MASGSTYGQYTSKTGEFCGTNSFGTYACESGLSCLDGKCFKLLANGATCTRNNQCQSDYCKANSMSQNTCQDPNQGLVEIYQTLDAATFGAFGDYVQSNIEQNEAYGYSTADYNYLDRVTNYENLRAATQLGATLVGEAAIGVYAGAAAVGALTTSAALAGGATTANFLFSTANTAAVCTTPQDFLNNPQCQMATAQNVTAVGGFASLGTAATTRIVSTIANTGDVLLGAYNTGRYCAQYGANGTCLLFAGTTALGTIGTANDVIEMLSNRTNTAALSPALARYDFYDYKGGSYFEYVQEYGLPEKNINTVANPRQIYGFQADLIAAAKGENLNMDQFTNQLSEIGIGLHIYTPQQMKYAAELANTGIPSRTIPQKVLEATSNGKLPYANATNCPVGFCPNPTTTGFGPFKKTTQEAFVLAPTYLENTYNISAAEAQIALLQKMGHELGHAGDDLILGGMSPWASEIRQKQFNAIFYNNNNNGNNAIGYQGWVDTARREVMRSGGNITYNPQTSTGSWASAVKTVSISGASNWNDLNTAIENLPNGLTNSRGQHYSQADLKKMVENVRSGKWTIDYVTSAGGLRDKVASLLNR
jgi:hypothetical protein